jgi:cystathionine gamma-synthase
MKTTARIGSTLSVHAGEARDEAYDAIATPIVQTSTYSFKDTAEIESYVKGEHPGERNEYARYGNPTSRATERAISALEGTDDTTLFGTGMAAITTTLLALIKGGQHVILFADGYRQTRQLVAPILGRFGVAHTIVDASDLSALAAAIRPETRLVVGESPTNPHLTCVDLAALAEIVKAHRQVKTVIDSTFATPVNCRPADFGADLIVHSATKYLAGHNDLLAGSVSGSTALVSLVRDMRNVLGTICDPHAAWLLSRGLRTLGLRVARHNENGLAIARFLEGRSEVEKVFYPGLASHRDHAVATRQMTGFGGVVSFVCKGGLGAARSVVDRLEIPRIAASLGGVESLVEPPALMSYYELTPEERAKVGIEEGLVRYSAGIEDTKDLLDDLAQALDGL